MPPDKRGEGDLIARANKLLEQMLVRQLGGHDDAQPIQCSL
jgi:hypothetical protein